MRRYDRVLVKKIALISAAEVLLTTPDGAIWKVPRDAIPEGSAQVGRRDAELLVEHEAARAVGLG